MSDSADKLSQLANQHRAKKRRTKELNRINTPVAKNGSKKILFDSFAPRSEPKSVFVFIVLIFIILGACWVPVLFIKPINRFFNENSAFQISFFIGTFLIMYGIIILRPRIIYKYTVSQLKKIKYHFNVEEYLQLFSQARKLGQLEIEVQFSFDWSKDRQDDVQDAVKELMPEVKSFSWQNGNILRLKCENDVGIGRAKKGENGPYYSYFTNYNFHKRFMLLKKKVLPLLHEVISIDAIKVNILGDVVSPARKI